MNDTSIPDMCLEMINLINKQIHSKKYDVNKNVNSFKILIIAPSFCEYKHSAIQAIKRTYKPLGYNCKMTYYKRRENGNPNSMFGYAFSFEKSKYDDSDLPF